jgi:UPF0176 protein
LQEVVGAAGLLSTGTGISHAAMTDLHEIAAFYRFARLPAFTTFRQPLLDACRRVDGCGSILLASEGINGTIATREGRMEALLGEIKAITGLDDIEHKTSFATTRPFKRMKVRLKKEIVTIGTPAADPLKQVGTYVAPEDWNALITDPGVIVIDARNSYEFAMGSFENAVDPGTRSFGEFPDFVRSQLPEKKTRKIAMFCTGGIRCEKASSFMLAEGFAEVFQLQGGILGYLEKVPEEQSLWRGSCFVFDEREGVGHGLKPVKG